MKNARFKTVIKVISDINILNELDEDDKTAQKEDTEIAELNEMTFKFGNVAISAKKIKNSLSNSVIYDFDCNQSLTYDKARFVGEIISVNEWVDISNDKMLIEDYDTMLVNDKLEDNKIIKMKFAKTAYISFTNMTLVSLNKLKKKDYVWDMQEDVLIHKTSDQKVCGIEEHYELATIEFNPMKITHAAVEKITPFLTKEDALDLKENVSLMAKLLAKEDVSKMTSIVTKEDASIEEKKNTMQNHDAPTLKKSHTDLILAAVTVVSSGEEKLMAHKELFGLAIPASDWSKSAPDNPKWMNQKKDLIQSVNDPKKSRSPTKKRCKKRRLKIPKPL